MSGLARPARIIIRALNNKRDRLTNILYESFIDSSSEVARDAQVTPNHSPGFSWPLAPNRRVIVSSNGVAIRPDGLVATRCPLLAVPRKVAIEQPSVESNSGCYEQRRLNGRAYR